MKDQYQQRLSDWEEEKKKAFEALHNEINSERTRLMQALQTSLQQEREKSHILEQRQVEESRRKNEEQALLNGAEFTARLLGQLNHPELQNRLFELVLEQLPTMPADKWESLRALYKETQPTVKIVSAFPIAATQQHALQQELSRLAEVPVTCEFIEDESLIAGLRINFGPFVVRANLQDELQFFTESAYGRQ